MKWEFCIAYISQIVDMYMYAVKRKKVFFVLEIIQEWIYNFYEYLQSSYQGL